MRLRKTITTIVATAILLAGWQLFAVIANQPELIPSLPRLVRTLCEWLVSGSFYQSVGATILRGVLGMSISFVCAIGMAGLFARFEWVYELFRPLLHALDPGHILHTFGAYIPKSGKHPFDDRLSHHVPATNRESDTGNPRSTSGFIHYGTSIPYKTFQCLIPDHLSAAKAILI